MLRDPQAPQSETPIVYCQAESEAAAGKIHQRIWNQGARLFASVRVWAVTKFRQPRLCAFRGTLASAASAAHGSFLDSRLLSRIARHFPTLRDYANANGLKIHEGFQLRKKSAETTAMPQLADRLQVDFSKLKHCGQIFTFPSEALSVIPKELAYLRKRGGLKGLEVSEPPHIIIDASRRFAIYSDAFIAVPARKIGISGPEQTGDLLRALALYLSSSFCRYQQFFSTPEWGVRTSLATLNALRKLPIPLVQLTDAEIRDWAMLQESLAIDYRDGRTPSPETLHEIDARVYQLLGLTRTERLLVEDFVTWNMQVIKGRVPAEVICPPADPMIESYLATLKEQLDELVGLESGLSHDLHAVRAGTSAMLTLGLAHGKAGSPTIVEASAETATSLAATRKHLLRRHSQWFYFERSLKIYEDGTMYFFKPLEAIHWTRRQAILDAGEIVAETLGSQDT